MSREITANLQNSPPGTTPERKKPAEEAREDTINMVKTLELVRTTVLQLEEQLAKLKIDHEEALEKQASYKEINNQLQAQLAHQEVKNKNEITIVVDKYGILISRLVAETEQIRKAEVKLQEELAAAKHHLDNTEAVVATYKNNHAVLKKSIEEIGEIAKSAKNSYE